MENKEEIMKNEETGKKIGKILDYQRFEENARLQEIIDEVDKKYGTDKEDR